MSPVTDPLPAGYARLTVGRTEAVALAGCARGVRAALAGTTLHAWAGAQPGAVAMRGRAVAWATTLPGEDGTPGAGPAVVVRHGWHGGWLAPLTRDLWWGATRAPRELAVASRLAAAGVATPELVAYARYPAGAGFARVDVATRRLPAGADLVDGWRAARDGADRAAIVGATAALLRALADAGAWHADLNLKNVYIAADRTRAWVLDVDRITFLDDPRAAGARNLARLARSWAKWRARHGLDLDDAAWERLRAALAEAA